MGNEAIFWNDELKAWIITSYPLVKAAFSHPQLSCDRKNFFIQQLQGLDLNLIKVFLRSVSKMMVMNDQP